MNNTGQQYQLAQLFAMCRAKPNYKALYATDRRSTTRSMLDIVFELLRDDEATNFQTGFVLFPNGSTILIKDFEVPTGYEFHRVFVDELVDEEMAMMVKTRERL